MAQEQRQEPPAKEPSLLARVVGSRIAQKLGIFGVGINLFSGLQPFLDFSRIVANLVNHWREWTRGFWSWLASFVHLDPPAWASDLMTLVLFIVLFTARAILYGIRNESIAEESLTFALARYLHSILPRLHERLEIVFILVAFLLFMSIYIISVFLTLYPYLGPGWAWTVSGVVGMVSLAMFAILKVMFKNFIPGLLVASENAILIFICLLTFDRIALHSDAIEAFIGKALQ